VKWLRAAWKAVIRAAIYLVVRPLLEAIRWPPPDAAAAIGARLGGLAAWLLPWEAAKVRRNLARAFPELEPPAVAALARETFCRLGAALAEYASLTWRGPEALRLRTAVDGLGLIEEAQRRGRGAVVLTGHLGNWEMAAAAVALRAAPFAVIARALYDSRLSRLAARWRAVSGTRTFDTSEVRSVLAHLEAGGVLGVLADQGSRRFASLPVPWFGAPATSPVGPVKLASRTGASLLMGFVRRHGGVHRVTLEPLGDGSADPATVLARFNARLEALVRERPADWPWMHDRWRDGGSP
jgi:KDO2-lipid IV(A) lauroyltransferase